MSETLRRKYFLAGFMTCSKMGHLKLAGYTPEKAWDIFVEKEYRKVYPDPLPEEPTGDRESPAADGIRSLAGRVGDVLTSNTEPPKHTRRRNR